MARSKLHLFIVLGLAFLLAACSLTGTPRDEDSPSQDSPPDDGPAITVTMSGTTGRRLQDLLRLDPQAAPYQIQIRAPGVEEFRVAYVTDKGRRWNLPAEGAGGNLWQTSLTSLEIGEDDRAGWLLLTGRRAGQAVEHVVRLEAGAQHPEVESAARRLSAALMAGRREEAADLFAHDMAQWIPADGSMRPYSNFALLDTSSGWPLLMWQQEGYAFRTMDPVAHVVRSNVDELDGRATVQLAFRVEVDDPAGDKSLWLIEEQMEFQRESGEWALVELFRTGTPLARDGSQGWPSAWREMAAGEEGVAVDGAQRIGPFTTLVWDEEKAWDPQGRKLVFLAENFGQTEVWQVEPRTQEARRLLTVHRNRVPRGRDALVRVLGWFEEGGHSHPLVMISFLQTDAERLGEEGIRILTLPPEGPRELLWLSQDELGELDWYHEIYDTADPFEKILVNGGTVLRLDLSRGDAQVLLEDLPNNYLIPVRVGPAGELASYLPAPGDERPRIGLVDLNSGRGGEVATVPGQWIGRGGFAPQDGLMLVLHALPNELDVGEVGTPKALIGISLVDGQGETVAWLDAAGRASPVAGAGLGSQSPLQPTWLTVDAMGPWRLHPHRAWSPQGDALAVVTGLQPAENGAADEFAASRLLVWEPSTAGVREIAQLDGRPVAFMEWLVDPNDAAHSIIALWDEYDPEEGRWQGMGFDPVAGGPGRPLSRPDGVGRHWVGATSAGKLLVLPGIEEGPLPDSPQRTYPGLLVARQSSGEPFAWLNPGAMARRPNDRVLLSTPYSIYPVALGHGYVAVAEETANRDYYPWRSYFWVIPWQE